MKKTACAAVIAACFVAGPAVAEDITTTKPDPFISTQMAGGLGGMGLGGVLVITTFAVITAVAASGT
ncbi:hypothetical protein [Marimonas arenosa]|uniref:Uncharacterized protein n=1 Tax=Marimonas arenosa TaxID=1795305 RepID=A0AAE4B3X2_9RHOB|nr:hypothetical protein [Marimonas arenosa]MDQ2089647.1 hypothetical protein [Marimonas arenosa]